MLPDAGHNLLAQQPHVLFDLVAPRQPPTPDAWPGVVPLTDPPIGFALQLTTTRAGHRGPHLHLKASPHKVDQLRDEAWELVRG